MGFCSGDQIRRGAVWGLLTSTFVHSQIWHVAFNVYWLWVLGTRLEKAVGHFAWFAIFFGTAVFSSLAELAVAGTTGIGASGAAYGLFGFMWVTSNRFPEFKEVLDARTSFLFLVWLIGCVVMSLTGIWSMGNAAHVGGLIFGAGCGAWLVYKEQRQRITRGLAFISIVAIAAVLWAPWSSEWTSWRALRAHENGDYPAAIRWYRKSLQLGCDKAWCWHNMALAYHEMADDAHYKEAFSKLQALDPKAATNLESEIARDSSK